MSVAALPRRRRVFFQPAKRAPAAAAEEDAPLHAWLERHQLAGLPRFWQKIRIDHGWETAVESVLRETAVPLTSTQTCGLYAGSTVPNAVFGSGRIDAYAAVSRVSSDPIFVDGTE